MEIQLKSEITCPNCGHKKVEECQQTHVISFTSVRIAKQF
jgi:transcription elongation factor Elf1